jgi:hypothetical protein
MLDWLIRGLLFCSAGIAGWFVPRDAPNFSMIQVLVLLVLMAAAMALAITWAILRDRTAAEGNTSTIGGATSTYRLQLDPHSRRSPEISTQSRPIDHPPPG